MELLQDPEGEAAAAAEFIWNPSTREAMRDEVSPTNVAGANPHLFTTQPRHSGDLTPQFALGCRPGGLKDGLEYCGARATPPLLAIDWEPLCCLKEKPKMMCAS